MLNQNHKIEIKRKHNARETVKPNLYDCMLIEIRGTVYTDQPHPSISSNESSRYKSSPHVLSAYSPPSWVKNTCINLGQQGNDHADSRLRHSCKFISRQPLPGAVNEWDTLRWWRIFFWKTHKNLAASD